MAYSETISQTVFTTDRVLRSAVRRTKLPAAQLTSEDWSIAGDELYLMLGSLANQGVPLWCIQKVIQPLYDGISASVLPLGIVDVLNSNLRSLSKVTGTITNSATTSTVVFADSTAVTTVGVLWSAAAVAIALERSNDGVTWTTVQSETPTVASGEWSWYDLYSSVATTRFRVRATTGTLGFTDIYLGNNPTEMPLSRMNRDQYANMPNKSYKSARPLQFWFDRQIPYPIMHLWPAPNASATTSQLTLLCHRHIMDVGSLTQELEVPQRWYDAIVAGLAARLGRELIAVDPAIIPQLDSDAAKALYSAQMEERDNSPVMIAPNIAMYSR